MLFVCIQFRRLFNGEQVKSINAKDEPASAGIFGQYPLEAFATFFCLTFVNFGDAWTAFVHYFVFSTSTNQILVKFKSMFIQINPKSDFSSSQTK